MNKEWSNLNQTMRMQLKKEENWQAGIGILIELRNQLMNILLSFKKDLLRDNFYAISFFNADGYHSKTIGYSI